MKKKYMTLYWTDPLGCIRRAEGHDIAVTCDSYAVVMCGKFGTRHGQRTERVPIMQHGKQVRFAVVIAGISHPVCSSLAELDTYITNSGCTVLHNIRSTPTRVDKSSASMTICT